MKRILFLCMTVMVAVAVNAQCYFGGTLGIAAANSSVDGSGDSAASFAIVPEFGYEINKIFTVGGNLGIAYNSAGADVTTLSITPFGRATFARVKIVDFFAELQLSYNHSWVEGYSADGFGIGLLPGLKININDKWAVLAKTALLQYNYMDDVNSVGFSIGGAFNLGVAYNF